MRLLDWNSIENSRHGITVPKYVPSKFIPLLSSDVRRVFLKVRIWDTPILHIIRDFFIETLSIILNDYHF